MARKIGEAFVTVALEPARDSKGRFVKVKEDLDDLGDAATKTEKKVLTVGEAMAVTGQKADTMARKTDAAKDELAQLKRQALEAEAALKILGRAFAATGDRSLLANIRQQRSALNELKAIEKTLLSPETGGAAARTFTQLIQGGIIDAFSAMPAELKLVIGAALGGAVVAGSAFIGAALNAALVAGIGLGGLAAGIVGQISNPEVQAAFSALGSDLKAAFKDVTASFAGPLVIVAHQLAGIFQGLLPPMLAGFQKLSTTLVPLTVGLSGFLSNLTPGLNELVNAAVPMLKELATLLPGLGKAFSLFAHELSGSSTGATEGLRTLIFTLEGIVVATGHVIGALSNLFHWYVIAETAATSFASSILGWVPLIGPYLQRVHDLFVKIKDGATGATDGMLTLGSVTGNTALNFGNLSQAINQTVITADTLAGQMVAKIFNATMGVDQATLQWHQSLTTLGDTLKANGRTLDENTAKGQANVGAILAAVSANMQQYQAQLAVGISAHDAAAAYDANTAALEGQLRKAGLTQAAIDGLIGKYRNVPDQVNTNIAILGLTEAISQLDRTIRLINGLHDKTVVVTTRVVTVHSSVGEGGSLPLRGAFALGGIRRAQVGMLIPPSNPGTVLAGEPQTGGEVLTPLKGISKGRAMGLSRVIGDAYGFDVLPKAATGRWTDGATAVRDAGPSRLHPRDIDALADKIGRVVAGAVGSSNYEMGRVAGMYLRGG